MIDGNAPRVRTELQVMFFDTDCGGVVHNIAYLRFIEVARTLLAEKLGLPPCGNGGKQNVSGRRANRDRLSPRREIGRSTRGRRLARPAGTRTILVRLSHHSARG